MSIPFCAKNPSCPGFPRPGIFCPGAKYGVFSGYDSGFSTIWGGICGKLVGVDSWQPFSLSFSYTKRKRKELAVPMRFSWQAAAYGSVLPFCDQKGSEKVPPFRCGGRRLGLRPQTPKCGHLTTAYSPAWGPVNKEWIKNHFPVTNAGQNPSAKLHPTRSGASVLPAACWPRHFKSFSLLRPPRA